MNNDDEASYWWVLSAFINLIREHGWPQVMADIHEIAPDIVTRSDEE